MGFAESFAKHVVLIWFFIFIPSQSFAVELKQQTSSAFDSYVSATETRMTEELRPGRPFLYIDTLPSDRRASAYRQLAAGEIFITPLQTMRNGKDISIPDGIVHHWVGMVFIPKSNLATVLSVVQNYGNRAEVYKPDVIASRLISHQGDDYKIFMRLFQKKFTTIVFNTEFDIHWHKLDQHHIYSNSYSTRIAEVKDPNKPDGPEFPAGKDHGYLWRLYTYWRFAEQDGGVYMQCEAISLTRDIPFGLGWLLRPLVTSIPRQSLNRTLGRTRSAVLEKHSNGTDKAE